MKNVLIILIIFSSQFLSTSVFSQEEIEEAPMFGTTRAINTNVVYDFSEITNTVKTHQFKIKNTGKTNLRIVDIKIPEKVGITLSNKSVKPNTEGIIYVSIDPAIAKKGTFSKKITVFTEQKEPGVIIKKEITFKIKGNIK